MDRTRQRTWPPHPRPARPPRLRLSKANRRGYKARGRVLIPKNAFGCPILAGLDFARVGLTPSLSNAHFPISNFHFLISISRRAGYLLTARLESICGMSLPAASICTARRSEERRVGKECR